MILCIIISVLAIMSISILANISGNILAILSVSILAIIPGSILAILSGSILAILSLAYLRFVPGILAICTWHTCDLYLTYLRFLSICVRHTCDYYTWHTCDICVFGHFCPPYLRFRETYLRFKSQVCFKKKYRKYDTNRKYT